MSPAAWDLKRLPKSSHYSRMFVKFGSYIEGKLLRSLNFCTPEPGCLWCLRRTPFRVSCACRILVFAASCTCKGPTSDMSSARPATPLEIRSQIVFDFPFIQLRVGLLGGRRLRLRSVVFPAHVCFPPLVHVFDLQLLELHDRLLASCRWSCGSDIDC